MAVRIGLVGRGFMGSMHLSVYGDVPGAKIVAICDVDPNKRKPQVVSAGNVQLGTGKLDLGKMTWYDKLDKMLRDPQVDVVDITLPTSLHAEAALKSFAAGKHVICEKPMALNSHEAEAMADAARGSRKRLFVAHCIRYWPVYAKAREIILGGRYGKVLSARFVRLSLTPTWSWTNWLLDARRSGCAALDLHIHDTDFVLYTFGAPTSVCSHGVGLKKGHVDQVITSYEYSDGKLVTAEGGWIYAPGFGFQMQFAVVMEKATLLCAPDLKLMLHPVQGKSTEIRVSDLSGYALELRDFISCLGKGKSSKVITPESACQSVKLIEAEVKSVRTGKRVAVKL